MKDIIKIDHLSKSFGDVKAVHVVRGCRGHRGQPPPTAGQLRLARGGQNIAAVRTLIKLDALHIASIRGIRFDPTAEQAISAHPQRQGQRGYDGCVGHAGGALPFGDGLGADMDAFSQGRLGQPSSLRRWRMSCATCIRVTS